jgi:hypothetical protein
MKRICDEAKKAGVTAVIACDLAGDSICTFDWA